MSIKDLPHVTVEQVLALRKAAIEIEKELATAKQEKEILKVAFDNLTSSTKEWYDMYANLKASLPKVRADAVREAKKMTVLSHNTTNKDYEAGFDDGIEAYDKQLDLISEYMEAGND